MSDFAIARQNMVDCQVRPSDVTDNRIIDAMLAIPREILSLRTGVHWHISILTSLSALQMRPSAS